MTAILIVMGFALAIAATTVGMVLMGIEGRGRRSAPKLVDSMAKAARHLNGDAPPPRALVRLLQ